MVLHQYWELVKRAQSAWRSFDWPRSCPRIAHGRRRWCWWADSSTRSRCCSWTSVRSRGRRGARRCRCRFWGSPEEEFVMRIQLDYRPEFYSSTDLIGIILLLWGWGTAGSRRHRRRLIHSEMELYRNSLWEKRRMDTLHKRKTTLCIVKLFIACVGSSRAWRSVTFKRPKKAANHLWTVQQNITKICSLLLHCLLGKNCSCIHLCLRYQI